MVWAEEQTDKWHRRGIPEIDPHNRVNYFGGGAKAVLWSKDSHFSDDTEQLDDHKPKKNKTPNQKTRHRPYILYTYFTKNSKCITDLHIKCKTMQLMEDLIK